MLKILRTYLLKLQVQMAQSTQRQLSLKPKAKFEIYTLHFLLFSNATYLTYYL